MTRGQAEYQDYLNSCKVNNVEPKFFICPKCDHPIKKDGVCPQCSNV
jgi:rubrerythrin